MLPRIVPLLFVACATGVPGTPVETDVPQAPAFADFGVAEVFSGIPAPVDFSSHRDARTFRTRLRDGARDGPNFAGQFTVVTWGCGTACTQRSVVDVRSGAVYFAPFALVAVSYRLDSRLLIVDPPEEIRAFHGGECPPDAWLKESHYYEWTGTQLTLVHTLPVCP